MGSVYINTRCRKILQLLLMREEYVSLQQLAAETKVSRRSIYYDLCKINEWLNYYGVADIEALRGKGILISDEHKKEIEQIVEQNRSEEDYIFSPSERIKIIYCYIMITHLSEPVYIEQLSEYCQVSRNTIFNDLRAVVNRLQEYNLTLAYNSKTGYKISGDVVSIRALFFMYFNSLLSLFDRGILNFLDKEPIQEYLLQLQKIEKDLNTEYVHGVLLALAALVPLMYKGARRPYFADLKKEKIIQTKEFQLVQKYFPNLAESEQIYLSLHLLGSRVTVGAIDMFDTNADQSVYEITKALVAEFEKRACVTFEDKEELERSLFIHISTSMYRYQYGIQIGNPMSDDIIREYPSLFDITKRASKYLEQMVGLPIPDSEIAYLALHFGAHLKISQGENNQLRILIVCANGISTGNMLKREVQALLPSVDIVGVVAAVDVMNLQNVCDLVISTVKIKTIVPVLLVHPILTDYDRKVILKHRLVEKNRKQDVTAEVYEIVKKYVPQEQQENLRKDLLKYFQGEDDLMAGTAPKEKAGLLEILDKDRVQVTEERFLWQEAVRFAGAPLLQSGTIQKKYLDSVISQLQYYGPYMFIAPGLLLAHAKPEDGVNALDVSLAVFKKKVVFSDLREAKLIIVLATEDQEKHLRILKDIMTVFSEEEGIEEVYRMNSKEEILEALKEKLLEEK